MLSALTSSFQQTWLLVLLVLWAVLLFGGFLLGSDDPDRRMRPWMRIGSSAVLVIAGFSWYWFVRGTPAQTYAFWIALGMLLGFIGDLWMAGWLPGGRNVMAGVGTFALCHVAYITAFLLFSNQAGLTDGAARWGALGAWLLVGLIGWYFVVYRRGAEHPTLRLIALPYALLLSSTVGLATGMALQEPSFWPLAIGAALFLLSDLILAAELFTGLTFRFIGDVIWLTYGPAQMLIVYSVNAALNLVK